MCTYVGEYLLTVRMWGGEYLLAVYVRWGISACTYVGWRIPSQCIMWGGELLLSVCMWGGDYLLGVLHTKSGEYLLSVLCGVGNTWLMYMWSGEYLLVHMWGGEYLLSILCGVGGLSMFYRVGF